MRTPAISVIITCYNPKNYIKQCIKSVLRQSMTDFEVIVVDDGSTNLANLRCAEKMSHKDKRLRIIMNKHQGVSLTRKEGYLQAKGEYIFFMDDDDFLPKDALRILYKAATETGADVTVGNYACVADSFGLIRIKKNKSEYDNAGELIQKKDVLKVCYGSSVKSLGDPIEMAMWCRLYKSSLIKLAIRESDIDLFTSVKLEDYLFNLLLFPYIESIYLTNDICYYYRFGGVTSTFSYHLNRIDYFFNCRFDLFEKWNFQEGHPRTFVTFATVLLISLKNLILSGKCSKDETVAFLSEQMSSNKIVDWTRRNVGLIEELPQQCKILATEKPEVIYCWYSNALHSKRSRIHRVRKKCALACSKVLDIIYEALF